MRNLPTRHEFTAAIAAVALALASGCGPGSDSSPTEAPPDQQSASDATLTISPSSGPDGQEATVTVTGAQANSDVDIRYGAGNESAPADQNGTASKLLTFNGQPGEVEVVATGIGNVELARGVFTITGPAPGSSLPPAETTTTAPPSTVPDPNPPAPTVTLTVSPTSGKASSPVSIIVTGPPGEQVTLFFRGQQAQTGGSTDQNGNYTFATTFTGTDGEVIDVRADMTVAGQTGSASGTFTITPSVDPPPTTTPEEDETGEPIGFIPGSLELMEFHETDRLPDDLILFGALSALIAAWNGDIDTFDLLFLVFDENGSGALDDGDRIWFDPQPVVTGEDTWLPIDTFGTYFVGGVPEGWTFPEGATEGPLDGLSQNPDGSWQLTPDGDPVIFEDGFESGTPTAWIVDGSPAMP